MAQGNNGLGFALAVAGAAIIGYALFKGGDGGGNGGGPLPKADIVVVGQPVLTLTVV